MATASASRVPGSRCRPSSCLAPSQTSVAKRTNTHWAYGRGSGSASACGFSGDGWGRRLMGDCAGRHRAAPRACDEMHLRGASCIPPSPDAVRQRGLYRGFTVGKGWALRFGAPLRACCRSALSPDVVPHSRAPPPPSIRATAAVAPAALARQPGWRCWWWRAWHGGAWYLIKRSGRTGRTGRGRLRRRQFHRRPCRGAPGRSAGRPSMRWAR